LGGRIGRKQGGGQHAELDGREAELDGEAELFTGGEADWVGDIRRLQDLGVTSVDVRLFGYGEAQTLQGTIDNMHRFRDGVLSKLA